jgi:hypothetical protein
MESSQISIGIVGYGYWGPNLVCNLASIPSARYRVSDLDPAELAAIRHSYPGVMATLSYGKLLVDRRSDASRSRPRSIRIMSLRGPASSREAAGAARHNDWCRRYCRRRRDRDAGCSRATVPGVLIELPLNVIFNLNSDLPGGP